MRQTRSNPEVLGEDLTPLLFQAIGAAGVNFLDERITFPLFRQVVPGVGKNAMLAKVVDLGTTVLTTMAGSKAIGMIDSNLGRQVRRGGAFLVAGKILGFIPGFGFNTSFPNIPGLPNLAEQPKPKELPAAESVSQQYPPMTNYPRPVGVNQSVGL